jgi:hypothetical protein
MDLTKKMMVTMLQNLICYYSVTPSYHTPTDHHSYLIRPFPSLLSIPPITSFISHSSNHIPPIHPSYHIIHIAFLSHPFYPIPLISFLQSHPSYPIIHISSILSHLIRPIMSCLSESYYQFVLF